MNEHYNEIPSLSDDPEEEDDDLKMVDMVPSEDQYLTETDDDTDSPTDDEDDSDDAPQDETHENDNDDSDNDDVPLDEQEEEENTIMNPTTAKQHYIIRHADKQSTTTSPGMLNLHLNLNLNKEGEQSMSQRKAALTVQEVNEQNHVKDTGYNFQSAQDRPATLDQYDLTNDPHRDFDNMQGQTNVYSMKPTPTTAMRLAARMLKHGLRDGDVNNPVDVADIADEIRDTMSEGEARDKADILKEMDDKNDNEIREIEREIHDDKDHMKMDDHDIHDDEKHLKLLETAHRHARYRKADTDLVAALLNENDIWDDFIERPGEWGKFFEDIIWLDYTDYHDLQWADDDFVALGHDTLEELSNALTLFILAYNLPANPFVSDLTRFFLHLSQEMNQWVDNTATASHHSHRSMNHYAMKRHTSSYRKASQYFVDDLLGKKDMMDDFIEKAGRWGTFLGYLTCLDEDDFPALGSKNIKDLSNAMHQFAYDGIFYDRGFVNELEQAKGRIDRWLSESDSSTASRHSRRRSMKRHTSSYRKADYSGPNADIVPPSFPYYLDSVLKSFYLKSDGWALLLNYLASIPDLPEYDRQMIDKPGTLAWLIDNFTDGLDSNIINRLQETANLLHNEYERDDERDDDEDEDDEDVSFFASRHSYSRRRYAAADEHTVCDVRMTKDGDYEARCDGKVKRFDKKGDALEWLSDHFTDSYQDKPEFHVKHDESRRARRRYAEEDEKTVCDVRKTKDGDYEARCDGKVKRFDKKGDALEWLYDHFTDSYKDEPEFTDKDKKAARLQKLIAAHRKQIMSSKAPRQIERTPSVRMASTMSPSKTDISSILL